jgi:hypothetical protein
MGMKYQYLSSRGALRENAAPDGVIPSDVRSASDLTLRTSHRQTVTDLLTRDIPQNVIDLVPVAVAREYQVIPIEYDGESITFAAADPDDLAIADKLRFRLARNVVLLATAESDIRVALNRYYIADDDEFVDSMLQEFTETAVARQSSFGTKMSQAQRTARARVDHRREKPARRRVTEFKKGVIAPSMDYLGRDTDLLDERGGGMFFYTVDEGQRVLVTHRNGSMEIVQGPAQVWRGWKTFRRMGHFLAHPGEFLIVRCRDGSQQHLPGPSEVWFDPRVHDEVTQEDCLQIAAREAIVVYSEMADGAIARRIVHGPALFTPQPGEWLHTFSWHASDGGSNGTQKVPNGLVFQKLWMMPDQMYHDVPNVRTADDALLTIRLMVFYELVDIDQMLDTTHDPIGDFVNAATADVVEFVGRFAFEDFKQATNRLNEIDTYSQLVSRATQSGYRINNVVYRGYGAPESLQQMHDQAIETRTRLQLERVTEEQAQGLEDYKLNSQLARAGKRREEQADEVRHDLELDRQRHSEELRIWESRQQSRRNQKQQDSVLSQEVVGRENETRLAFLESLSHLQVDLTSYLTQNRADRVIEVRGESDPHIHLQESEKAILRSATDQLESSPKASE